MPSLTALAERPVRRLRSARVSASASPRAASRSSRVRRRRAETATTRRTLLVSSVESPNSRIVLTLDGGIRSAITCRHSAFGGAMSNQINRRTFLVASGLTAGVAAIGLGAAGQASAVQPKLPPTVLDGLRYWAPPT